MANSGLELLEKFKQHPFTKAIGFGVVDVHSHRIESLDEVKASIRRALEYLEPEQVYVDPDCGLKTRTVAEAEEKLQVIQRARDEVRAELETTKVPASR